MIVPAVISIFLFGASFLIFTAYYFWRIYSLTQKNQMTSSHDINIQTEVVKPTQVKPQADLSVSVYIESEANKNPIQNSNQYEGIKNEDIVNIAALVNQKQNNQIEQSGKHSINQLFLERLPPIHPEIDPLKKTADLNDSQLINPDPTNRISIEAQKQSQISNNTLKQTEDFYAKVQNAYLLISCLVFGQAIISRIFIVKLNNRIDVKDYFYLSAINTALAIILYNIIYGLLIFMLKNTFVRIPILRFGFIFYGLIMPFPLYNGLSDEIRSDFLIVLIAIGYMIIVQGCLQKCKNTQNIITQTELMIV